jgi:hypothetical protein
VQTFHEPPSLRPCCSSLSAIGHPRAGTKLHRARNPRLGKVNGKTHNYRGRILSQESLTPTTHRPSFPTCLLGVYTFTVTRTVLRLLNLPCIGLQQQTGSQFSELCGSYRTPSRTSHFLRTLSHLERVTHRLGDLFFDQFQHSEDTTTRLSNTQSMAATSHGQELRDHNNPLG